MYQIEVETGTNTLGMQIRWWNIKDEFGTTVAETRYEPIAKRICDMLNSSWHKEPRE